MSPSWPLVASLLLGAAACAPRAAETARPAPAAGASQTLRAYRDPVTGALGEPPPGAALPAPPRAPAAAPAALAEEAAPGGGRMIRLRGAFRSHVVGRAVASGATVSCGTAAAPSPELPAGSP